jgi:glycosyltransferase involved in cell wall biosynthesis
MNAKPLITIGIPTRNRLSYLQNALKSAISQTYSNIEIVISDNFSNDGTEEYLNTIRDSRVKIFRQSKLLDMIDNWNFCLKNSSGNYFILLSDDDSLDLNAVEKINKTFCSIPHIGKVAAFGCNIIDEQDSLIKTIRYTTNILPKKNILSKYLLGFFSVPMCSTVHYTESLREIGGYSQKHVLAADTFAWLSSVFRYGNLHLFPENIANYRIHSQMTTKKSHTSLWIKEYINLCHSLNKEIPAWERPGVFLGLVFVIFKQLLKAVLTYTKIR